MLLCLFITSAAALALAVKIYIMKKSLREIRRQLEEKLSSDTNTLIGISSSDKDIRSLAADLNEQLKLLRSEHIRFRQGDAELKKAVTNISHDLRTPLTAIVSYLDLLEDDPGNAEKYLPIIRERAETMGRLTEELFRYSVIASPEYDTAAEPVQLNSVLEESLLAFYANLREKGITPEIDITERKIIRSVNRAALSRVFANILGNAVKYSDGDLTVSMNNDGVIVFSNSSAQLNEVQAERLFDRFYTIESADKSTGLGLSIARSLVKQMNGEISAEYENGRLYITIVF